MGRRAVGSGMRSPHGGADQSASATEQDGRNDACMWIPVSFGSESSADAKADEGTDQNMAPVGSLPPHSIAPPAWISDLGRSRRDRSALGTFWKCLAITPASCKIFVQGVRAARNENFFGSQAIVCSLLLSGLRQSIGQKTR